jgi:hypothetical protein
MIGSEVAVPHIRKRNPAADERRMKRIYADREKKP